MLHYRYRKFWFYSTTEENRWRHIRRQITTHVPQNTEWRLI